MVGRPLAVAEDGLVDLHLVRTDRSSRSAARNARGIDVVVVAVDEPGGD